MKIFFGDCCYLNVFVVFKLLCLWENVFGFFIIVLENVFGFFIIVLDKSFILLLRNSRCDGEIKAT